MPWLLSHSEGQLRISSTTTVTSTVTLRRRASAQRWYCEELPLDSAVYGAVSSHAWR